MRVLKKIAIITFSLWCTRLLESLVCRYGQKVTLVKKCVSFMPGKGGKLKITVFTILVLVQVVYLTNHSIDTPEAW